MAIGRRQRTFCPNAAEENVDEAEDLAADGTNSREFKTQLEASRRCLDQMRKDFPGLRERKWKISEAADASGLKSDYKEHYSLLSKAAHNTPSGLASKADPRILVSSVLRLLYDTVRTCECLVYFRPHDDIRAGPLTKNWSEVGGRLGDLISEYDRLGKHLNQLFEAEFGAG